MPTYRRKSARKVPPDLVTRLLETYQVDVGGTQAYPGHFPTTFNEVRVRPRLAPRNELLGTTVTRPADGQRLFGISYEDRRDGCVDEDFYLFDASTGEITYFPKNKYEQRDPRFQGTHRGDKSYLRQADGHRRHEAQDSGQSL